MWKYTGNRRPDFAESAGPGQESVWDYPRPPALQSCTLRVEVRSGGDLVACTEKALRVLETASPPTWYLPPDVYLRTMKFDIAGLDRWERAAPRDQERIGGRAIRHRGEQMRGVPIEQLEIDITGPAKEFLFLPPSTLEVEGIDAVVGNLRQEEFFRLESAPVRYRVKFQHRGILTHGRDVDRGFPMLTRPPSELGMHESLFRDILHRAGVRPGDSAPRIADLVTTLLQREYRYELREPEGDWSHSILNFVDGEKCGFCMHFASALAICLRIAGIPCRIGVGLYGTRMEAGEDGELVMGSRHAHAWVEVPFEEIGWIVFDPTPETMLENQEAANGDEESESFAPMLVRWTRSQTGWVVLGLVMLGALLAIARRSQPRSESTGPSRAIDRGLAARFAALIQTLSRWSQRERGHSLQQWAHSLARHRELPIAEIEAAFASYEEVRFGRRPADDGRTQRIADLTRRLRAMKRVNA